MQAKNWEDTVLNAEQLLKAGAYYPYINFAPLQNAIKAQAEISFPAGEKQGIQKVVEWIEINKNIARYWRWEDDPEWQAQLKDWGL